MYWGGNYKQLTDIIEKGLVVPSQIKFFVGYSGWTSKQLDAEIKKNYWLVGEITPEQILNFSGNLWKKTLEVLDPKYQTWKNFPENPIFN